MQYKIKAGILGAAGYTGGELIRILLNHPAISLSLLHSNSQKGKKITSVHQDLLGETDLLFSEEIDLDDLEVLFLCMGHGESKKLLDSLNLPPKLKIIDLSQDFRLYTEENPFVYGLPELNRDLIKNAQFVANPGCFATAIQLALLPFAHAGLLKDEIHLHGITGSTGAGQALSETSQFSWRVNNISVYKAFQHQHLAEIRQSLIQTQPDFQQELNFIPIRGNFSRGIFLTAYFNASLNQEEAMELIRSYYQGHEFVLLSHENPHLKQVVNTNKAILYTEKQGGKIFIISCIDNLLKGASGQAVQNMNLMFGLPENTGLQLKAVYF